MLLGDTGLSEEEAAERLRRFGANEIQATARSSVLRRFAAQFCHFFAALLWVAALLALIADLWSPGQGMRTLSLAIVAVILLNGVFSFWQEYRAERTLDELKAVMPREVMVLRAGSQRVIPAEQVVPGDILILGEGDRVPADCRVLESWNARVDSAAITGESLPELKEVASVALAGSVVLSGRCRGVVFATGMDTQLGKTASLTERVEAQVAPLQLEIQRLSRTLALIACSIGLLFFLIGRGLKMSFLESAILGIGIIVANVPEGLLPTVSVALAMASRRMAKRNALVRSLPAVQALGSASVICTDKTGTLTRNQMQVRQIHAEDRHKVLDVALNCHELREVQGKRGLERKGDPMEIALFDFAAGSSGSGDPQGRRIAEIPFDSARKRLTTVHQAGEGQVLYVKGAMSSVLPLCSFLDAAQRGRIVDAEERLASSGMRVLAFAYRHLPQGYRSERDEKDLVFAGLVGLEDPVRPEVPEAIRKCRSAGIRVIMLTGDHPRTALAVAKESGLVVGDEARVITGDELQRLTDAELKRALAAGPVLFARLGSDQKLRIVEALQEQGEIVAVTGDGVNDAPALRKAAIGVAMGRDGTDVAREASDIILLDDNFATIVSAIEEGRSVFLNVRKFLTYILASNVPELLPYLGFAIFKIPLALTIIQILAIDLGTDIVPALGLGAEPPEGHVMGKSPREFRGRLLDWRLLSRAYLYLGLLEGIAALAVFFIFLKASGWSYPEQLNGSDPIYQAATAACFGTIVIMQMVNVFVCRSESRSSWAGLGSNKIIVIGVGLEVLALVVVVYTPLGNLSLGTAPVPWGFWGYSVLFAMGLWVLEEGRKWAKRKAE
ncbi:MAG: cation-transporting P-type ATPase [Oligoflexia bacterium]|nr:cation-transporting P-type ATPase [Oligoflexia bacterium]